MIGLAPKLPPRVARSTGSASAPSSSIALKAPPKYVAVPLNWLITFSALTHPFRTNVSKEVFPTAKLFVSFPIVLKVFS